MSEVTNLQILPGGVVNAKHSTQTENTGTWRSGPAPKWLKEKCLACLICVNFCPENAIRVQDGKIQGIDETKCKGCRICIHECPAKALVINENH